MGIGVIGIFPLGGVLALFLFIVSGYWLIYFYCNTSNIWNCRFARSSNSWAICCEQALEERGARM